MAKVFTVYALPTNCPYCKNAKDLLERQGFEKGEGYTELLAGENFSREELIELIGPVRTLPQILVTQGQETYLIGGYTDLIKYFNGELPDMKEVFLVGQAG